MVKDLGRDIRNQLHLKQNNRILDLQLALFQPTHLQLVVLPLHGYRFDESIQTTMFKLKLGDAQFDVFGIHDGLLGQALAGARPAALRQKEQGGIIACSMNAVQSSSSPSQTAGQHLVAAPVNSVLGPRPKAGNPGLPRLTVHACVAQHLGDRTEQQDRVAVMSRNIDSQRSLAFGVLADGLGGMSGGAMAAENVMMTSRRRFDEFAPALESPESFYQSLVDEVHTVLKLTGMTTGANPHSTFAAVLMQNDRVDWCHIGDSRIYHIRERKLIHCTSDHTYAQELIASGKAPAERARLHPAANQLVNALGSSRRPIPTLGHLEQPRTGDTFLLCSDGLWNYFHAGELVLVIESMNLREAAETLMQRARDRAQGQGDNCSLALMRYVCA